MNHSGLITIISITALLLSSCNRSGKNADYFKTAVDSTSFEIKYAEGFKVYKKGKAYLVEISDPQNKKSGEYKYALLEKEAARENIPSDYTIVEIPVDRLICMTALQLSNFIKIKSIDRIAGITSSRHLFNREVKEAIAEGKIKKIGIEGNFDNEIIMSVNPDIILISPFKKGGYDSLKETGIPLMSHFGYKETTPLGQAEWIKLSGLLIGEEETAFAEFKRIETEYNRLKDLCKNIKSRPTVLSGEMRGGNWYVVGGKSYLAELFRDAGAEYFLKDDNHSGGFNLDYETVYNLAAEADFWRLLVSHNGDYSYKVLKKQDIRYGDFRAFKNKGVIYCNLRNKPFYENTPVEPEIVLSDMIKAFHPELLPEYQPVYYELMK